MFPRTASRRDHPSIWSREAVPRGQRARSRGLAISIHSHPPFGHERPSLLGSAPVPAVFAGTSCRLKAPASPASRGLRRSLRSRLRVAFWGWRRGSGDVAVRDRCGRGSPGPSGESWRDQAVRAGGGSRGELMVPLYSARWALVSPFSVRAGGVGATSREANRSFTR